MPPAPTRPPARKAASHDEAERDVDVAARRMATGGSAALKRRPHRAPVVEPPASGVHLLAGLVQDARHGLRLLKREPGFALVAILTIALGHRRDDDVVHRSQRRACSDRCRGRIPIGLIRVERDAAGPQRPRARDGAATDTYLAWADRPTTIDAIGGVARQLGDDAEQAAAIPNACAMTPVTPSLFPMLAAKALASGACSRSDEGVRGSSDVDLAVMRLVAVALSAAAPTSSGRRSQLDDRQFTIVGVMPQGLRLSHSRSHARGRRGRCQQLVGPGGMITGSIFSAMARLRPGATTGAGGAEGTARGAGGAERRHGRHGALRRERSDRHLGARRRATR